MFWFDLVIIIAIMDYYREHVLDHFRHHRNKRRPEHFDLHGYEVNEMCGDKLEFFLSFDQQGVVTDVSFQGEGCALSQASASMLSEQLIGKTRHDLETLSEKEILALFEEPVAVGRIKCVLLSLAALRKTFKKE